MISTKSAAPSTCPEGKLNDASGPNSISSTEGRCRSTTRPMIWPSPTPTTIATASSSGRHACRPIAPHPTLTISTMIGSAMGPNKMAKKIMTTVSVGERQSSIRL